jgi:hypothetical protein
LKKNRTINYFTQTALILLTIICFLLQIPFSFSQDEINNKADTVIGGYKSCIVYQNNAALGKFDIVTRIKTAVYKYNDIGKKIEQVFYNRDGSFKTRQTYKYDAGGNKTEEMFYKTDTSIYDYTEFKYDDKGNMTNEIFHDSDGTVYREYLYYYDAKNNPLGKYEKRKNDWGWDIGVWTCEYDTTGILINKRTYYETGLTNTSMNYIYIDSTNETRVLYYSDYGVLYATMVYKHDERGNMIEEGTADSDGLYSKKKTCKYDPSGNITEEKYYGTYNSNINKTYKYNNNGNITEEAWCNCDESVYYRQAYKYDDNGNIIEIIAYNKAYEPSSKVEYDYLK